MCLFHENLQYCYLSYIQILYNSTEISTGETEKIEYGAKVHFFQLLILKDETDIAHYMESKICYIYGLCY